MDYNDKTKQYQMADKVQLEVTGYDWMFTTKMVDEKDEKKMRALTEGNTKVLCDRMTYSEESGVAEFYASTGGQVSFEQPKRGVKASYIEVNDKTKDFYAEGVENSPATYTQTDGEWLYQAELIKREDVPEDVNNVLKSGLTATASSITYNYDRRRVEMRGGVKIEGTGSLVQAGELVQDETAKFFLLRENVLIQPNADTEVRAAQVYVDTANDVLTFVGLVQGKTKSDQLPTTGAEQAAGGQGQEQGPGQGQVQPGVFGQGGLPGQGVAGQGGAPPRGASDANIAERR
jgi:lipopolysaccharide assembly outer membrane protein LptD (OstA)